MSIETVFTFLSKVFAKISISFSLFFIVIAAGFYFDLINDTIFTILFTLIIILLLIDTMIKFVLKQGEAYNLYRLEKAYIANNYDIYRATLQKSKKSEDNSLVDFIKGIGLETAGKIVEVATTKIEEISDKKEKKDTEKQIELIKAEIAKLDG